MNEYNDVKQRAFASGEIDDGYFGAVVPCLFSLIPESGAYKVVAVWQGGYFTCMDPMVTSEREAVWLLNSHRSSRAHNVIAA